MLTKSLEEMVREAVADGFITPEEGERAFGRGKRIEPSIEETTVGGLLAISEDYPQALPKVLGTLTPEARLAGMTAKDRLTGLTAEEVSKGLSDTGKSKTPATIGTASGETRSEKEEKVAQSRI